MANMPAYADEKVLFVSNNLGTSLTRINAISSVSISSYALYASLVVYSHALTVQRRQPTGRQQQSRISQLAVEISQCYQRLESPNDKGRLSAIIAAEAVVFVLPLLLSLTLFSSTAQSTALSLCIAALAIALHYQARHYVAPISVMPQGQPQHSSEDEGDFVDEVAVLLSQPNLHDSHHHLRNRKVPSSVATRHRTTSSRSTRSYSESDDDEIEVELLEKRNIQRTRPQKQSTEVQVSVESGADQAWAAAHPPESWVEPDHRGINHGGDGVGNDNLGSIRSPSRTADRRQYMDREHDPFLTIYRSHMMLITIACILAVDFPIFARELGKCETWGASLMDMGVGSFVFSLGIVSAAPYLKPIRPPLLSLLRKDVSKCLPLLVLGTIRVITVKLTAYPEHVTEYGVHWNFFLTLAALPLLKTFIEAARRIVGGRWSTWGLLIALLHQVTLTFTPLQDYVISSAPRTDSLLAANREGIFSLPGYLSILLISLDVGLYILPRRDPYQAFRSVPVEEVMDRKRHERTGSDGRIDLKAVQAVGKKREGKRLGSLIAILGSWATIYWTLYSFSAFFLSLSYFLSAGVSAPDKHESVAAATAAGQTMTLTISRRLANLPYILWVAAFNISFLAAYTSVYWLLLHPIKWSLLSSPSSSSSSIITIPLTPHLLMLVNEYGFPIFLFSNILTGLINLALPTMYSSTSTALVILILYMLTACIALPVWILPSVVATLRLCLGKRGNAGVA